MELPHLVVALPQVGAFVLQRSGHSPRLPPKTTADPLQRHNHAMMMPTVTPAAEKGSSSSSTLLVSRLNTDDPLPLTRLMVPLT